MEEWRYSSTNQPFYCQGNSLGTHWIGGLVGSRAGLDMAAKIKNPFSLV
jgi:hypothetical protein